MVMHFIVALGTATAKLVRRLKKTGRQIGIRGGLKKPASLIEKDNNISQEKRLIHFPLPTQIQFNIGTGQLPVPLGIIKFFEICKQQ